MKIVKDLLIFLAIVLVFLLAWFFPVDRFDFFAPLQAAFDLVRWYAREHVLYCLIPAFFIAGAIAVFLNQGAVIKYFGAKTSKWISYTVSAVSGTILAVCSCTVLPLFSSIRKRGAGLGPAIAFLYSGPAINILAIIMTFRILGWELGVARIIGAVVFAVVIGLIMAWLFRREEQAEPAADFHSAVESVRPMWQTVFHFFVLVSILIIINWAAPETTETAGIWRWIFTYKWAIASGFAILLAGSLIFILKSGWSAVLSVVVITLFAITVTDSPLIPFLVALTGLVLLTLTDLKHPENTEWTIASWGFAKQIMPLLAIGVLIAGFLLGSTHEETAIPGIIPSAWINRLVGGNSVFSNLFASVVGAFMYFATLTEIPILQGLMSAGMGKGPSLALLLAGPSLSLPNMLVIRGVLGTKKTIVYVLLVIFMATVSGVVFGAV